MNVLITSGASEVSQLIAGALGADHDVRVTELPDRSGPGMVACDLGHEEETGQLCDGIDAIVLVCEAEGLSDSETVDFHSRKMYNLLSAASEGSVKRVVLLSSLRLFEAASPEFEIDEQWAPSVTPDPDILRYHIAEFVCREFARAHQLGVTCLRVGDRVNHDPSDDQVLDSALVEAVSAGIQRTEPGWSVFHVVSSGTRFVTERIEKVLNVSPRGSA
jgi:nucleoside-diphosphate-sugar epimerase